MANGIIFQIPRSQPLLIFLVQVVNTLLIVRGCTQMIPSKDNDKCQSPKTHLQWIKRWSTDSSFWRHIGHLLANLKFLRLSISSVGTFPLIAAQAEKQALIGFLDLQIASVGKSIMLEPLQTSLQKLLIVNFFFESWGQRIISSPTGATLVLASSAKKFKTLSSSQSLVFLHWYSHASGINLLLFVANKQI